MVKHINPYLLARLSPSSLDSASHLLEALSKMFQPFRLMQLPPEVRRVIYGYMVPSGNTYQEVFDLSRPDPMRRHQRPSTGCCKKHQKSPPTRRFEDCKDRSGRLRTGKLATIRKLCAVSLEFRNEVSSAHYSSNSFVLEGNYDSPEDLLYIWTSVVEMEHLRKLSDLRMNMGWYRASYDSFHVTYDAETGLSARVTVSVQGTGELKDKVGIAQLEMIKKRRNEDLRKTTGVIEFFALDPDALRGMPYEKEDVEEYIPGMPDGNERNAYDVAYGSSEFRTLRVWAPW